MRLGRKNLMYSMALAGILLLFLVGYFTCMLPSLYVDYVLSQHLKSIREQHRAYMEQGSYEGVRVNNSTACISVEIPAEGEWIVITGKAFSVEVRLQDQRLNEILDRCRKKLFATEGDGTAEDVLDLEKEMEELGEILRSAVQGGQSLPVNLRWRYLKNMEEEFFNESVKIHSYSDGVFVIETSIEDSGNRYENYIAIEQTEERLVLSFLPVVAPEVGEIRPVVLQSLPMLGAVIVLLVLLGSQMYSGGIVNPIVELVRRAEEMRYTKDFSVERVLVDGTRPEAAGFKERVAGSRDEAAGSREERRRIQGRNRRIQGGTAGSGEEAASPRDEVQQLACALEDLYRQIRESYRELEEKNRELAEENERQEIFLRASSHQLKTPIAAALLLVEGMMNEIGRYKETKVYLPRVKEQLLSMRKMVEDILYLNRSAESMSIQRTDAGKVLTNRLQSFQVALTDRHLVVDYADRESLFVDTDETMLAQILDNLLSNAVKYTPTGGCIRIRLRRGMQRGILIENFGGKIPEDIAPHIFDPFVSGSHEPDSSGVRSHGLGLYLASYYARKLDVALRVENGEGCVVASISFPERFMGSS